MTTGNAYTERTRAAREHRAHCVGMAPGIARVVAAQKSSDDGSCSATIRRHRGCRVQTPGVPLKRQTPRTRPMGREALLLAGIALVLVLSGCWIWPWPTYPCTVNCGGCTGRPCPPDPTPLPTCTSYSPIIVCALGGCGTLDVDPTASPPQARLRVGTTSLLVLGAANRVPELCESPVGSSPIAWVSSDATVATIRPATAEEAHTPYWYSVVQAVNPGDTLIFAEGVQAPEGPVRARLAYCPDARSCVPVDLVLRVIP
jgi:hypothetical protein